MSQQSPPFGQRLLELRKAAGLTQQDVAGRTRISRQVLSKLELGEREPTWDAVCRLAQALQVGVEAFAGNDKVPAVQDGTGHPSPRVTAALRRRQAKAIGKAVTSLATQVGRGDFVVCTFLVLKRIKDLLAALAEAETEANSREILRQLRNTLMNGGWNKYRDPAARRVAAEILTGLAEADEVLPQRVDESFDRLYTVGLNPVGARLFGAGAEDTSPDGEDDIPG